jgi:hypothetical protein
MRRGQPERMHLGAKRRAVLALAAAGNARRVRFDAHLLGLAAQRAAACSRIRALGGLLRRITAGRPLDATVERILAAACAAQVSVLAWPACWSIQGMRPDARRAPWQADEGAAGKGDEPAADTLDAAQPCMPAARLEAEAAEAERRVRSAAARFDAELSNAAEEREDVQLELATGEAAQLQQLREISVLRVRCMRGC